MGERNADAAAFAEALRTAGTALAGVPALLEGARVHETAFGKLFEAGEVREAYHQRLPETEQDIAEALHVIGHFVAGLEGGHPIGERPGEPSAERPGEPSSAQPAMQPTAAPTTGPAALPVQNTGGAD